MDYDSGDLKILNVAMPDNNEIQFTVFPWRRCQNRRLTGSRQTKFRLLVTTMMFGILLLTGPGGLATLDGGR